MSQQDLWRSLGFLALIAYLLWRNLPGALAFVRPSWIRWRIVGGQEQVAPGGPAMREMLAELGDLGFEPLGVLAESRPLARQRRELVLALPEARCFATVRAVGNEAWLSLVTDYTDGAAVITTDFHCPSIDEADYLAGGLPASSPAEVLNAHKRRIERLVEAGHPLDDRFTLDARVQAGHGFYAKGPGRREVRRKEIRGLVFATIALIWVGMFVAGIARNLGR
ncbi:hypothetical protein [Vulgatibacter incomptus]|uniref:Uncharacterized protein n=1 Tax=Vulgatibacter incomptus TaxID=1391653 RepID=A0A0K1PED9_9BACT|nr:hypothetical protein [Vulgatibacter incomptus]AKU91494.1 hypothetical protein AKJ08_1881 [Vulgatibacter incomptus]